MSADLFIPTCPVCRTPTTLVLLQKVKPDAPLHIGCASCGKVMPLAEVEWRRM
jgi:uncharacterized protein YbaR (Trm112 family)